VTETEHRSETATQCLGDCHGDDVGCGSDAMWVEVSSQQPSLVGGAKDDVTKSLTYTYALRRMSSWMKTVDGEE
jgi:hypothetical protein